MSVSLLLQALKADPINAIYCLCSFGWEYNNSCDIELPFILEELPPSREPVFYDAFLRTATDTLYPVPVKVTNSGSGVKVIGSLVTALLVLASWREGTLFFGCFHNSHQSRDQKQEPWIDAATKRFYGCGEVRGKVS